MVKFCKLLTVKFSNTTPLPSRIFVGGVFFFTSVYKPNIKSGFSLQPFIWQEKSLYFLVDI